MLEKTIIDLFSCNEDINSSDLNSSDIQTFSGKITKYASDNNDTIKVYLAAGNNVLNKIILEKIKEAKTVLAEKEFEDFLSVFYFNLDISVWGGEGWEHKILPNGAILIRNHHRVIAIDEVPTGKLDIESEELWSKLKEATSRAKKDEYSFCVIQHEKDGFLRTNILPEFFTDNGQTLVFLSNNDFEESKYPDIYNIPKIKEAMGDSRSGQVLLRIFKDRTYIYSMYRASDDLDTILEHFAYSLYYLEDEPTKEPYKIFTGYKEIEAFIIERINEEIEYIDFEGFEIIYNDIIENLHKKFARKLLSNIMNFKPFFSDDYKKTAIELEPQKITYDFQEDNSETVIEVNLTFSVLNSTEDIEDNFVNLINNFEEECGFSVLNIGFNKKDKWTFFDSGNYTKELKKIVKTINKEVSKTEDDDAIYCLENFSFCVILSTDSSLEEINDIFMSFTEEQECCLSILIPKYGFYCNYSDGEWDSGDGANLIIND